MYARSKREAQVTRPEKDIATKRITKGNETWTVISKAGITVAEINEKLGQIQLPFNPRGWTAHSYNGRAVPIRIMEVTSKYVEVEIRNSKFSRFKAYYFPYKRNWERRASKWRTATHTK